MNSSKKSINYIKLGAYFLALPVAGIMAATVFGAPAPVHIKHYKHNFPTHGRRDQSAGVLVGLACGDALGITAESGSTFHPKKPGSPQWVRDMKGRKRNGKVAYRPGDWSDDTSMALAIAHSLLANHRLNLKDMKDRFVDWVYNGTYDSMGKAGHGSGKNTRKELSAYRSGKSGVYANANNTGNGCIMRLAPIAICYQNNLGKAMNAAMEQARLTHKSAASQEASAMLAYILQRGITYDAAKDTKKVGRKAYTLNLKGYIARRKKLVKMPLDIDRAHSDVLDLARNANGTWCRLNRNAFISDLKNRNRGNKKFAARLSRDTLAVALWSAEHSSDFGGALENAVNMGGDSDTIGAVAGQIAGAIYGYKAIPNAWKHTLKQGKYNLVDTAVALRFEANKH